MIDDKKEIINGKLEHDTNEEIIEPSFFSKQLYSFNDIK